MTPPTLDELMKLAEAARTGPWWTSGKPYGARHVLEYEASTLGGLGVSVAHCPNKHDAAFLAAAKPDTVLKILRDYKRMRDFLERLELTMPFRGHFEHDCDCEAHNARACLAALEMGKGGE